MVQRTVNVEEFNVLLCSTDSLIRVLPDDCQLFMHRRSVTLFALHTLFSPWGERHLTSSTSLYCLMVFRQAEYSPRFLGKQKGSYFSDKCEKVARPGCCIILSSCPTLQKKQLIFHIRSPSTVSFRGWKVTTACTSDPFERNALHLYNSQTQIQHAIIEFLQGRILFKSWRFPRFWTLSVVLVSRLGIENYKN
jgi:hypothetical protein